MQIILYTNNSIYKSYLISMALKTNEKMEQRNEAEIPVAFQSIRLPLQSEGQTTAGNKPS